MAVVGTYYLKYYKQFNDERGITVRLEIHQRSYTSGYSYEIGRLQGLTLQLQGNEEVDAPIVKTSLQFAILDDSFVSGLDSNGIRQEGSRRLKYAKWTEFYTPDSTLYLVKLKYNGHLLWSGYITPDSYSESLDSFGSVVITARDNIGHLQDFDFDLTPNTDGLIRVSSIIDGAMNKINFPMTIMKRNFNDSDDYYLETEDGSRFIGDLYVNASALEDKNWYDALEETLNSIGFCLRFAGWNAFLFASYRMAPYLGYYSDSEMPECEVEFYGRHTGTRTFEPAYREIVEKIEFDQQDDVVFDTLWPKGQQTTFMNSMTVSFFDQNVPLPGGGSSHVTASRAHLTRNALSATGASKDGWLSFPRVSILDDENFPLQDYTEETEGQGMHNYLFLLANQGSITSSGPSWANTNHVFMRKVRSTQLKVKFEFAAHPAGFDGTGKLGVYGGYNLHHINYEVYYTVGSETRYWDGNYWIYDYKSLVKNCDPLNSAEDTLEFELMSCEELGPNGALTIVINQIVYQSVGFYYTVQSGQIGIVWIDAIGVYARLKSVTFTSEMTKKAKSDTVKTIVNSAYNVRCERKPLFGCLPTSVNFVDPRNYKNAFFIYDDDGNAQAAPYKWRWNTDSVAVPFPVKIHQQLLMFHYQTEQTLEGDCGVNGAVEYGGHIATKPYVIFDALFLYKNYCYLIKSCTMDFIKGRLTSVQLRSYRNYTQLWNGNETYNGNSSGSGGGSSWNEGSHSEGELGGDD